MLKKVAVILVFFLMASVSIYAQNSTVRVGLFPLEPLNFQNEDGSAAGFYPDLIREAFREKELTAVFVYGSWAECLNRLQNEEIDLITTIAYSPERAQTMDFSKEPVVLIWGQVFCRPDSKLENILSLDGKTVAVMDKDINGQNFIKTLNSFGGKCKIIKLPSHSDVLAAVKNGQALAGVAPHHFGLRQCGDYGLVGTSIQFSPFAVYLATKKGMHKELLELLDNRISDWKSRDDSFYYQRLAFWLGQAHIKTKPLSGWLKILILLVFVSATMSLWGNRLLKQLVHEKTEALLAQEREFHELVESANSVILRLDKDQKIQFINQYGLKLFKFSSEELIGKHVLGTIVPLVSSDGENLKQFVDNVFLDPEKFTLVENENLCSDGQKLYIQWANRGIYTEDGQFKELLCIGQDNTNRRLLEQKLLQAQKMDAVGRLAGGIAHDFNNILFIILANAELAKLSLQKPTEILEALDQIEIAGNRAKNLVQQILSFSRSEKTTKVSLNLAKEVEEAIKMLRATLPSTIKINLNLSTDKHVMATSHQLYQIIMNLCTNSMHALAGTPGILGISVDETAPEKDEDGQDKEMLRITVSDNGRGIDPEILDKIFDPFFTTKSKFEGTGMGLSVVHGIVKDHGGAIRVFSEVGKGTTFEVFLPVCRDPEVIETSSSFNVSACNGSERIMLIDDEQGILDVNSAILKSRGYQVSCYNMPLEALKAFENAPDQFDLIMTDMTMPEINGLTLARKVFQIRPGFPVILATGYSEQITPEIAEKNGLAAFLYKPLSSEKLLVSIRKLLDPRTDAQKKGPSAKHTG